jgi:hypothetical protein
MLPAVVKAFSPVETAPVSERTAGCRTAAELRSNKARVKRAAFNGIRKSILFNSIYQ